MAKKRFNLFLDFLVKFNQLNDLFYKTRLPVYSNIFFILKDNFLDLFKNDTLLHNFKSKIFSKDSLIKCFTDGLLFLHNFCNSDFLNFNIKLSDYIFFFDSINYFSFKELFKYNFFIEFDFDFFFKYIPRDFFFYGIRDLSLDFNNFSEPLEKIDFNSTNFLHEYVDSLFRNQVHKDVIFFLQLDSALQKKIDDCNFMFSLDMLFEDFFVKSDNIAFINPFGFLPSFNKNVKHPMDLTFLNSLNFIFFFVDNLNFFNPHLNFKNFLTCMALSFAPFIKYIFSIDEFKYLGTSANGINFFEMLRCFKLFVYITFAWFNNPAMNSFLLLNETNGYLFNADFFMALKAFMEISHFDEVNFGILYPFTNSIIFTFFF